MNDMDGMMLYAFVCSHVLLLPCKTQRLNLMFFRVKERFSGALHGREYRGEFDFATFMHDSIAAGHAAHQPPCRSFSLSIGATSGWIMFRCHRAFHLGSVSVFFDSFPPAGRDPV